VLMVSIRRKMSQSSRRAAWKRQDARTSEMRWVMDRGTCQAEGCYEEGEVHHVDPKGLGGTTHDYALDEKVTLCRQHHALIHDTGEDVLLKDLRVIGPRGVVDE
jgi:hypothetical protein